MGIPRELYKRNPTEIQAEAMKQKYEKKIELENLRHQHILEEIKSMKEAGIKCFVRYVPTEQGEQK